MTEIYLIRHAIAEERSDRWPDDAKRPLSAEGIARMRKAAKGLVQLGVRFDVVLTSPLVRARQTADIVASAYEHCPPIVLAESLAPDGDYADVLADLEKHAKRLRIAAVGHEPSIGELAARLSGSRRAFAFRKGAVCRIDLASLPPSRPGTLQWFLPPGVLRLIRK